MSEENPYLQMHQASDASIVEAASLRNQQEERLASSSPSSGKKIQRSNTVTPPTGNENDNNGRPNPYLALRQANIARNEARLRELGLLKSSPKRGVKRSKPSSSSVATTTGAIANSSQPVRRSSRRTAKRSINYKDVTDNTTTTNTYRQPDGKEDVETELQSEEFVPLENDEDEEAENDTNKTTFPDKNNHSKQVKASKPRVPTTAILSNLAPNSARSISLYVHRLVLDPQRGWLGKPMTATGKATVMETAAQQFTEDGTMHRKISFNKYSGAQDWKRGMFLWVNLGGKGNTVVNDFLEGGRKMTWYGGSRMKAESNIIQKLLQVGRAETEGNDNNTHPEQQEDGIVLWCRRYEPSRKNFGPYYCLGRLAYDAHNPNVMPVSFVWRLLDYDALVARNNEVVQQMMSSTS